MYSQCVYNKYLIDFFSNKLKYLFSNKIILFENYIMSYILNGFIKTIK